MKDLAIAIFAYNRPTHLRKLLLSLRDNPNIQEIEIYLFIDGPRNSTAHELCLAVLNVAKEFETELELQIKSNLENSGLSRSIRNGLDLLFQDYEKLIILEDDLVLSPDFISFMIKCLKKFQHNEMISSISGYSYPIGDSGSLGYLLPGGDCWGWATWKDRWTDINWDSKSLLADIRNSKREKVFNLNGAYDYTGMLIDSELGLIDSWAIYWHASMFIKGKFTYYPIRTLVVNQGMDGSGTHFKSPESGIAVEIALADSAPEVDLGAKDLSSEMTAYTQSRKSSKIKIAAYNLKRRFRRFLARIRKYSKLT
jgi:hypothetical protein